MGLVYPMIPISEKPFGQIAVTGIAIVKQTGPTRLSMPTSLDYGLESVPGCL